MPDHLIGLSVGPVQGFIAAARRTRDLWFGSYVLSEVSKAAAWSMAHDQARLIFPAPQSPDDLAPDSGFNVGNRLLAVLTSGTPEGVLTRAKAAAGRRWRDIAETIRRSLPPRTIRSRNWNDQVDDIIELYGAWVPLNGDYAAARRRLDQVLAARKQTRLFVPAAASFYRGVGYGLPKSSLDAARATVLEDELSPDVRRRMGLGRGEQLDCPGLVKRMAAKTRQFRSQVEQFPPATRIALEPWLESLSNEEREVVSRRYEPLVGCDMATRVALRRFSALPFDGGLLFPSRIETCLGTLDKECDAHLKALAAERNHLFDKHGRPTPYFAVMVADGDRLGAFIDSQCQTIDANVRVSKALADFAGRARRIVASHKGACVYAGGDDVLGLLPIHTAVACARALKRDFADIVTPLSDNPPTLSVGLGIGHVMTPFANLLDLGRRAERLAKDGPEGTPPDAKRNALAIVVGVRSGVDIAIRGGWHTGIDARLERWADFYRRDLLSDRTPYDLARARAQLGWVKGSGHHRDLLIADLDRVLTKKRSDAGTRDLPPDVKAAILAAFDEAADIDFILDELRVGRWLAQKVTE